MDGDTSEGALTAPGWRAWELVPIGIVGVLFGSLMYEIWRMCPSSVLCLSQYDPWWSGFVLLAMVVAVSVSFLAISDVLPEELLVRGGRTRTLTSILTGGSAIRPVDFWAWILLGPVPFVAGIALLLGWPSGQGPPGQLCPGCNASDNLGGLGVLLLCLGANTLVYGTVLWTAPHWGVFLRGRRERRDPDLESST